MSLELRSSRLIDLTHSDSVKSMDSVETMRWMELMQSIDIV